MKVLVVDDNASLARGLKAFLEQEKHETVVAFGVEEAQAALEESCFDLIITDLKMPDGSGLSLIEHAREKFADEAPEFILMTAFGSVDSAVSAMKLGVADYLTKPVTMEEFSFRVKRIEEYLKMQRVGGTLKKQCETLRSVVGLNNSLDRIIGESAQIQEVKNQIKKVAPYNSTVLITGETGVGKEMVAKALHNLSPRDSGPFVRVNCASIPETLFESELFGHEKGAFTDAKSQREGCFMMADGGTLFLDEIGEIPLSLQAKLLRALQEKEVARLGSSKPIKIDVRIVAATNRDLASMVEAGTFREDLLYRLSVFNLHVPPLRDRKSDIRHISLSLLKEISAELGRSGLVLSDSSIEALGSMNWPGNIRQLKNYLERAAVMCDDRVLTIQPESAQIKKSPDSVSDEKTAEVETPVGETDDFCVGLVESLEKKERDLIEQALIKTRGVKSRAAELLKIPRTQLLYRMKRLGLLVDES